jgi:SAM-dependent methyltransferase
MPARPAIKRMLQSIGLLDVARDTRDAASSLACLRENAPFWLNGAPDRLPVPPLRLVRSSTGTSSLRWFFRGGRDGADAIAAVLERRGVDVRNLGSILDFGCGSGRVIRHWAASRGAIHGSDYNAKAVRWCRRHLRFAHFVVNGLAPPLPYDAGQFDLVYALSVFTHLPEPLLFAWLDEMRRILKPGGWLVITTHGDAYLGHLTADEQAEFHAGRMVVKHADAVGTNRCGVYVSEDYMRRRCPDFFRVVDFLPRGAAGNPVQDLVLLQKA